VDHQAIYHYHPRSALLFLLSFLYPYQQFLKY